MALQTNGRRITREDVQAAFSEVLGEGESAARDAAPRAAVVAAALAFALLALVYLAGKRRGRRRTAVLEIRRI